MGTKTHPSMTFGFLRGGQSSTRLLGVVVKELWLFVERTGPSCPSYGIIDEDAKRQNEKQNDRQSQALEVDAILPKIHYSE